MTNQLQSNTKATAPESGLGRTISLQRRCGCGQHTPGGSECNSCKKNTDATLPRGTSTADTAPALAAIGRTTQGSIGQPAGKTATAFSEPRFNPDLNRVQLHTDVEAVEQEVEGVYRRKMHCPPVADTVANTVGKGGAGTLGFTQVDSSSTLICAPVVTVDNATGTCSFKARPINLSITSKFAQAGPAAPSGLTMKLPNCGNKDVPILTTVTQPVSDLVKVGEQEHCDDLNLAFSRTLKPCHSALTALESQKFKARNDGECLTAIFSSLGFNPLDCTKEFLTLSVDQRDPAGWHDFDPTVISKDCNSIVTGNVKSATNKIGDPSVAPSKIIAASTMCARPATPAPSTSGPTPVPPTPAPPPSAPPAPKPPETKPKP
jgi:hypothetical protein